MVVIKFTTKKEIKKNNFNISLNYQVCRNNQCKAENIIISMDNGKLAVDQKRSSLDVTLNIDKCKNCGVWTAVFQIIIAFLSGIVLNFMPCVLPILGIKLSSLSYGDKSHKEIKFSAFMSLMGIMATFIFLGLMASVIKLPFENNYQTQTWGFMFQNRYFILFLTLIVALFIDVQRGKAVINFNFNNKFQGGLYNFFGGVFSTILASPCVAPVIGLSIVYSSNARFEVGLAIFMAIGLGFGLPYIIAIFYPDIYKKIPKTGKISIVLSQILNGFLFATFFWLVYIISRQSGIHTALFIMVGIFVFSRFGWKMKNIISKIALLVIVVTPMLLMTAITYEDKDKESKIWKSFSHQNLDEALVGEKIILVLGTADWCSWCHILEKTVLERDKFLDFTKQSSIVMLKFDVTEKKDDEVSEFYNSQEEHGLPILRIYSTANPNGRSIIKNSFTINSVINEIKKEINFTRETIIT